MKKAILVPYPAQGHVTPMLKLATQLVVNQDLQLQPVLVTPEFIHRRIMSQINPTDGIICMSIPDGLEESSRDFFGIEKAMENYMPFYLKRLVVQLQKEEEGVGCIIMIVDLLASYAMVVGRECGIKVAGFWPAMLSTYRLFASIPQMLHSGFISQSGSPVHEGSIFYLPGGGGDLEAATINAGELPWLIGTWAARKSRFKFWTRTMSRSSSLPWLLVNSFSEECNDHDSETNPMIFQIQPIINMQDKNKKCGGSIWEEDLSCLDWLDKQSGGSVVYVSFGSWVSPIGEAKVKSLALTLEASGRPFLWVLGPAWRQGLPTGYLDSVEKQGRGKIVSWAPQMEVLKHEAVGCYLTHCGWNSTMEAIQCKKPLLCCPVAGDQFLNCAYIVKLWRIGIRMKGFGQRDVEEGLKMVMEDCDMGKRVMKLNEELMSKEATLRALHNLTSFIRSINQAR